MINITGEYSSISFNPAELLLGRSAFFLKRTLINLMEICSKLEYVDAVEKGCSLELSLDETGVITKCALCEIPDIPPSQPKKKKSHNLIGISDELINGNYQGTLEFKRVYPFVFHAYNALRMLIEHTARELLSDFSDIAEELLFYKVALWDGLRWKLRLLHIRLRVMPQTLFTFLTSFSKVPCTMRQQSLYVIFSISFQKSLTDSLQSLILI